MRRPHPPRVGHQLGQPAKTYLRQADQHQRPAGVLRGGEEEVRLTQEQRLLLGLVAHVEHGDVRPDPPGLARLVLGIGPDETPAAHPEVKAVAVDLLHLWQRQRQAAHVRVVSHQAVLSSARSPARGTDHPRRDGDRLVSPTDTRMGLR